MDLKKSCRCCLLRPPEKNLKMPYSYLGKTEIYADMLKECFEIHLTTQSSDGLCGICEVCVGRLRDASNFKLQVQRSQDQLKAMLCEPMPVKDEELSVKSEMSDDVVNNEPPIHVEVKLESTEDPLPNDEDNVFKEFVLNMGHRVSDVWKPEPLFEFAPILPFAGPSISSPKLEHAKNNTKKRHVHSQSKHSNTCDICGKRFKLKTALANHKRQHKEDRYKCEECNQQFKFKCHLDIHSKDSHEGIKPYNCNICNKRFAHRRGLYRHVKVTHNKKRFQCEECNKLFTDASYLNKHKLLHRGEMPYNCDICKAKFKSKYILISHMGRHTGQMHYSCKYCSLKFWDYKSLLYHRKIHTMGDIESYCCEVCHKVFTIRGSYISHLKTHTEREPYPCEFCPAKLTTLGSLKQHKKRHTEERPYACEICNKRFRFKHNLKAHIPIHTGEKSHCCEVCGKQFARQDNLKTHLETHVVGISYSCELCTKSYSTKEGLRQHRRSHTKKNDLTKSFRKKQNKTTSMDFDQGANDIQIILH
ncbi:gastrula zinc finger protein XlCGF57.1-like [Cydia pomonella]|uniref:gastrula zinc finger protein XlCGF57.1-like n=1 Tax=Cydia pomonella TaxID=82600 RepID=UPI002ADDCA81|nr:gastrula zinc finger protein XlCGF57.1-like [Cydia pomonella]